MSIFTFGFAEILFGLFGLSFFISKSAFTIFYSCLVIFGLIQYPWKFLGQAHWSEKTMIALYPLAILCNFFSLGGVESSALVFARWTWPLLFFPIMYLKNHKSSLIILAKTLVVSLFVACLYSYYQFYKEYNFIYDTNGRVSSFWDILRWSYFCSIAVIALFTVLFTVLVQENSLVQLNKNEFRILMTVFVMSVVSLVLTNSRAAWLGSILGIALSIIMQRKTLKYYVGLSIAVGLLLFTNDHIRSRMLSTFNVQNKNGEIVSNHRSNASRLDMWKVAIDISKESPFFGSGFENSKPTIENFLSRQTADYVNKYTKLDYSFNDQHSSYITMLFQFGAIYTIILYTLFFAVTWLNRRDVILIPLVMCTYFIYLFYGSIVSFEASIGFGLISFMILNLKKTEA